MDSSGKINKRIFISWNKTRKLQVVDKQLTAHNNLFKDLDSLDSVLKNYSFSTLSSLQNSCSVRFSEHFEDRKENFCNIKINSSEFGKYWDEYISNFKCNKRWNEIYHKIQVITENYSHVFTGEFKNEGESLNEQLRKLRIEFRKSFSKKLLYEIKKLVEQIRRLANKSYSETKYLRQGFLGHFLSIIRNLRNVYRQIVHFPFKNLDDESGDVENVTALGSPVTHFSTSLNRNEYESRYRQRKMDSNLRCCP